MKYIKQVMLAATMLVTTLGFASFTANANPIVVQDIYIDVFTDGGFGVDLGPGQLFGTVQYHVDNVVGGGIVTGGDDTYFQFDLALGSLAVSEMDDFDYGFGGPFATTDPVFTDAGLTGLFTFFDMQDVFGEIAGTSAFFMDVTGAFFEGEISFGQPSYISEPSILVLFMAGLVLVARRRFTTK